MPIFVIINKGGPHMNNSLKLPSIDYKEFKILTLCKNKEFANINHMAEELKVTTRSVRTYIKQLNENLGEDIAQIIYVKGYGYKLEIKNKEAFELLFEENKKTFLKSEEEIEI